MRVLIRFRNAISEQQLADFDFRYQLRKTRYLGKDESSNGLGWYRAQMGISMHPVWMQIVLNKDPLVCEALAIPSTSPAFEPPPLVEAGPCVAVSAEPRRPVTTGKISVLLQYVDRYPWFIDVVSDLSNYAGGTFYYRFYNDGTFEAVPHCMFCEPSPSP